MKYVSLLLLAVAATALMGCQTSSGSGWCPCLEANCCGWDFYQPCDLIEGRDQLCEPACRQGMVVSRCIAVPTKTEAAPEPAVAEPDVAEFGAPAAVVEEVP